MKPFYQEKKHDQQYTILFGSHKIEEVFQREQPNAKYNVIVDREEKRISSMLDHASDLGNQLATLQVAAITAIVMCKNRKEAVAISIGLIPFVPQGMSVCPNCLDQAIMTCEENLTALKDLREATKQYATVNI